MAKYAITNGSTSGGGTQQPTTTTYVGAILGLSSSTTTARRFKVYDVLIGTNGTPADATAFTVATVNSSTFGTITSGSNVFYIGVNTRASYRWVAAPGGELVAPATSSQGFQLRARSAAYTGNCTGTIYWIE